MSPDILGCGILECETVNGLDAKKAAGKLKENSQLRRPLKKR